MKNSIQLFCTGLLLTSTFTTPLSARTPEPETLPNSQTSSAEALASQTGKGLDGVHGVRSPQTANPSTTPITQPSRLADSPRAKPTSEIAHSVNSETELLDAMSSVLGKWSATAQKPDLAQAMHSATIAKDTRAQTKPLPESTPLLNSKTELIPTNTQTANSQPKPTPAVQQAVRSTTIAQTPTPETSPSPGTQKPATPETNPPSDTQKPATPGTTASPTTSTEDNTFSVRGGLRYTTEGAGYKEGFTSFEGFFPLLQTPGKTLTFLEGRLLLDNDANIGANVVLGQRFFDASAKRVYGGYIAYDNRDTGRSSFNQIGLGLETLGDDWDFRINGYLPVGDTRQQVSQNFFNPFFQGNYLLLNRDRRYEAAVSGVDAEFGGRLLRLGDSSVRGLRGYAGVYYINVAGGGDAVGVRGRLEARPTDYITLNLSVQNDSIFDTRVVGSVGITFPGSSARGNGNKPRGLDRMGDTVVRQSAIVVADQTKRDQVPAINPDTGQPYLFQHVNVGLGQSNGSFESPYGNVQQALNATRRDGNDIVYVRAGTNPGIPPFIIPDNVQVLSAGPLQLLNTRQIGLVQLPLSGSGILPVIRPGLLPGPAVTMGNNTVLSGFLISNSSGPGVFGSNIRNVTIRDNVITNSAEQGILLNNVTGRVAIADNTIDRTFSPVSSGIVLANNSGLVDLRIRGNTIANTTNNGIGIVLTNTAQGTATISNNTIFGNRVDGIFAGLENSAQGTFNISNNAITNNQARGIGLEIRNMAQGTTDISNNTISGNGGNGIGVRLLDTVQATTNISNNKISGNGVGTSRNLNSLNGIGIDLNNTATGTFNISKNTISGNRNDGIGATFLDVSQAKFTIADNTISNNGNDGIEIVPTGNSTSTLTISNNTISNSTRNGILINPKRFATSTVTISNNTVSGSGLDGISANTEGNSFLRILIQGNTSSNNGRFGIQMTALNTSRIFAGVRLNTLTANPGTIDGFPYGFGAQTLNKSTLCLDLRNNTSSNGFVLNPVSGTFNADILGNNVSATTLGTINPLGSCPVP